MLVVRNTTVREKQGLDYATRPPADTGAGSSGLISYVGTAMYTRVHPDARVCTHRYSRRVCVYTAC
jgi:hypothetical protein